MKKIYSIIAAGFLLISMSACKKDRTCTCTITTKSSASTTSSSYTTTTTLKEISGGAAKGACASTEETYQSGGASITETSECKLD